MPEKLRQHFMLYRAKISIYLDTVDFGEPMMLDATEAFEIAPADVSLPHFQKSIGPVRPGAEAVWIEGAVKDEYFASRRVSRIGAMVHQSRKRGAFERPSYVPTTKQWFIEPYIRDHDGLSRPAGPEVSFRLDENGLIEWCSFISFRGLRPRSGGGNPFALPVSEDSDRTAAGMEVPFGSSDPVFELSRAIANRVLFCLALTNCKNISLQQRKYSVARGEGPQGNSFHELLIGTPQTKSGSKPEPLTAENRMHLARGHFKTFTPNAPLLGRHVGTYWWGWQVRGDEVKGSVAKTYKLRG